MFDIASGELLLVALVALLVIGPKDLPRALRYVGNWVGKARRVAGQFRSGFDEMVRQSELEELERKWAEENDRIMREHPASQPQEYDSQPPPQMTDLAPAAETPPSLPAARRKRKKAEKPA
jgi:sec-independent protein translocase protein TatB